MILHSLAVPGSGAAEVEIRLFPIIRVIPIKSIPHESLGLPPPPDS